MACMADMMSKEQICQWPRYSGYRDWRLLVGVVNVVGITVFSCVDILALDD